MTNYLQIAIAVIYVLFYLANFVSLNYQINMVNISC